MNPKFWKISFTSCINFIKEMNFIASFFNQKKVLLPVGGDFRFYDSEGDFGKIDICMIFIKSNKKSSFQDVDVRYSTVNEYFEKNNFSVKEDFKGDFFPLKFNSAVWKISYFFQYKFSIF